MISQPVSVCDIWVCSSALQASLKESAAREESLQAELKQREERISQLTTQVRPETGED